LRGNARLKSIGIDFTRGMEVCILAQEIRVIRKRKNRVAAQREEC
jgi:hypothetical protein